MMMSLRMGWPTPGHTPGLAATALLILAGALSACAASSTVETAAVSDDSQAQITPIPAPSDETPAAPVVAEESAATEEDPPPAPAPIAAPPPPTVTEVALGPGMLEGEAYDIFWGTAEDPAPEILNAARPDLEGRHYLRSDERNHHLFRPYIADLGGAYAGVGAEQAYTFAAWSRARLVWLTDYDPWIGDVHRIYRAFFLISPDLDDFLVHWEDEREDKSLEILRHFYGDSSDWDRLETVADELDDRAYRRLRWMRRTYRSRDIDSWVTNEDDYDYVRTLIKQRRVRPMIANLLDEQAFVDIGRASRELGVPIRTLYLSNAESYWDYTDQYRTNITAQLFDPRSVILRTNGAQGSNGDYRYLIQPAPNYVSWLAHPEVDRLRDIWDKPSIRDPGHIPLEILYAPPSARAADAEPLPVEDPVTPGVD